MKIFHWLWRLGWAVRSGKATALRVGEIFPDFGLRDVDGVSPVTIKDAGDDVNVCYCFGFKRGDLRRDLEGNGSKDIPQRISRGIQESRCDCERENPKGACRLGNAATIIKEF